MEKFQNRIIWHGMQIDEFLLTCIRMLISVLSEKTKWADRFSEEWKLLRNVEKNKRS